MRRNFVANVSYELRTPLTGIKGAAEILLQGAEDARRLGHLVEDLLNLLDNAIKYTEPGGRVTVGVQAGEKELAMVKHIAQAHGGKVEMESHLGAGNTFRLTLPL